MPERPAQERVARSLAAVSAILVVLALIQQFHGLGLTKTFEIAPSFRITSSENAYRWTLPKDYQGELIRTAGMVLENDKPLLNRAKRTSDVRTNGAGWYAFNVGKLWFSPPDGSDPRINGRKYEVRLPLQWDDDVWYWFGSVLVLSLIWLRSCMAPITGSETVENAPPTSLAITKRAALIFTVSFCFAVFRLLSQPDYTDGSMVIKGVPESDAIGWHEIANGLVDGKGLTTVFESQRPLYSVMLTPVYWLFGGPVLAGKVMNCIALSVAVTGVWLIGSVLRLRKAGWIAGAGLLFSLEHEGLTHAILTENGGLCFSVLALLAAWLGLRQHSPRWCFIAGLVNGVGNLASGVMLLSLPLYALFMVLHSRLHRVSWRRTICMVAAFVIGASVIIVPWMVRQKVTHGHFTLSINNAELLYGGAHPPYGKFCGEVAQEATKDGIDPSDADRRYAYFSKKFVTLVSRDPLRYIRQVLGAAVTSFSHFRIDDSAYRTAGLMALIMTALACCLRCGGISRLAVATALAFLWLNLDLRHTAGLALVSFMLCYWTARGTEERVMLSLVALSFLALALAGGIAGNVAMRRLWLVGDWTLLLIVVAGLVRAVEVGGTAVDSLLQRFKQGRLLTSDEAQIEPRGAPSIEPAARIAVRAAGLYAIASVILACTFTAIGAGTPFPGASGIDSTIAIETIRRSHPRKKTFAKIPALHAIVARLDDLTVPMRAGEEFGSWQSRYDRREYDHTVCFIRPLDSDGNRLGHQSAIMMGAVGDVPRGIPLLWIGIRTIGQDRIDKSPVPILEVLAVVPLTQGDTETWHPNFTRAQWFEPTPESLQTGATNQPPFTPPARTVQ